MLFSFGKLGEILKGPGDQFVRKHSSQRGTHPFVRSLIKEEKETLGLMLEEFINTSLYSAFLRFSLRVSQGGHLLCEASLGTGLPAFSILKVKGGEYLNPVVLILSLIVLSLKESF